VIRAQLTERDWAVMAMLAACHVSGWTGQC